MIKLLQLIVLVLSFSCSREKDKNNNLHDVLYNSAINDLSLNYDKDYADDVSVNRKIVGYRHLNELIKSKTVIKELDLKNYYKENKNQFLRDGKEVFCFRFVAENIKTANDIKTSLLKIKDLNENRFGQVLDKHKHTRELINENHVKDSYYEIFFKNKNSVVGPLSFSGVYVVFYITKRYDKGTIKDYISVQDNIYNKIYKINSEIIKNQIIDSLMIEYLGNRKTK